MMMNLNLELRENLSIKYYLNLHLSDDHLDENSVLYEILAYTIQRINENKDKVLSYDNLKFSSKTLKYIFGEEGLKQNKDIIVSSLKNLIKLEFLKSKGKTIYITENGLTKFYNIKD